MTTNNNWPKKEDYLEIYRVAHNNATDLLKEAELLFEHEHFPRAYALAFTALEEISKSQFAADIFTGLRKEDDFRKFYKNHLLKIRRIDWAHSDARSTPKWVGPDWDDIKYMNPEIPFFEKRNTALFVGIDFKERKIVIPEKEINEKDAEDIIHVVRTAFQKIWEIEEYYGHQIGTKGFMK